MRFWKTMQRERRMRVCRRVYRMRGFVTTHMKKKIRGKTLCLHVTPGVTHCSTVYRRVHYTTTSCNAQSRLDAPDGVFRHDVVSPLKGRKDIDRAVHTRRELVDRPPTIDACHLHARTHIVRPAYHKRVSRVRGCGRNSGGRRGHRRRRRTSNLIFWGVASSGDTFATPAQRGSCGESLRCARSR